MPDSPSFLFVTCQVGAERAVKWELARGWPDFRFAYSRPGFLTFRLPEGVALAPDFELRSIFARSSGLVLGKVTEGDPAQRAARVWEWVGERAVRRVHVWPRDAARAGDRGYEPGPTPESEAARQAILAACPRSGSLASDAENAAVPARRGEEVLDCILVEPDQWWVGYHRADAFSSRWSGGMMPLVLPAEAVSRAWLKMEEVLRWANFPIPAGGRFAEIGSAPGGASQALLARGYEVLGIDPAAMDPRVLAHPKFHHIRRRAVQVRRRDFRKVRWLTADMNVAPEYTLDVVESIVAHPQVSVRGVFLTLKLPEWDLVEQIPAYLDRVRGWGFNVVRARQLSHHHQEFCVAALQKPFVRKPSASPRDRGGSAPMDAGEE